MKPYGREKKFKGSESKNNMHHKNGLVNWWENVISLLSRSRMKGLYKKEIENQINEKD